MEPPSTITVAIGAVGWHMSYVATIPMRFFWLWFSGNLQIIYTVHFDPKPKSVQREMYSSFFAGAGWFEESSIHVFLEGCGQVECRGKVARTITTTCAFRHYTGVVAVLVTTSYYFLFQGYIHPLSLESCHTEVYIEL